MFKSKKFWYISLFGILYLIVGLCSFWHAISFFGLANGAWMSVILAFAFEVGQAAVLFSLLTSKKDRGKIMPWILMTMFTLVQVIGNVFSSYKYLMLNSVEDLKYFKEPIFIWTQLPDAQATVIVTYIVGAILPVAALMLTSMITNYLEDDTSDATSGAVPEDSAPVLGQPLQETHIAEGAEDTVREDVADHLDKVEDTTIEDALSEDDEGLDEIDKIVSGDVQPEMKKQPSGSRFIG